MVAENGIKHILRCCFTDTSSALSGDLIEGELLHSGKIVMTGSLGYYFDFVWEHHFPKPSPKTMK